MGVSERNRKLTEEITQFTFKMAGRFSRDRTLEGETEFHSMADVFESEFSVNVGPEGGADIAFHPAVEDQKTNELDKFRTTERTVPLPDYLAKHVGHNLQTFTVRLNSHFSFKVFPELISSWDKSQKYLRLTCDRSSITAAARVLRSMLTAFHYRQLVVPRALTSFLDASNEGKALLESLHGRTGCTITTRTPGATHVLQTASAESCSGPRVELCEGALAASDCDVLVLPLCDGLRQWSPEFQSILQRGLLTPDAWHYALHVGPPPKPQTLVLQSQWPDLGQRLVIMRVPPSGAAKDLFETEASAACQIALRQAAQKCHRPSCSVAFPLDWDNGVDADVISRLICDAVSVILTETTQQPVVKLYDGSGRSCPNLQPFFNSRPAGLRWQCVSTHTASEEHGLKRLRVVVGDILNMKGDVVVNPTDPDLLHDKGQVSLLLLNKAGRDLLRLCKELYPNGIHNSLLAITDACNLSPQFKYIFHIVPLLLPWPASPLDTFKKSEIVDYLRCRVHACLLNASVMELSSLVFPALGTGTLRWPPEEQSRIIMDTIRHFFLSMPSSSLQRVTVVCYPKNAQVTKVFKAEETLQRFARYRTPDCVTECRIPVNRGLVQVILGDPTAQECTADTLVCFEPPATGISLHDYHQKCVEGCETVDLNSASSKQMISAVRDLIRNVTGTSVHISLETFGADLTDKVVTGVVKAMQSSSKSVLHVALVVPTPTVFTHVKSKLRQWHSSVSQNEPQKQKTSVIGICGSNADDVQKALVQVTQIEIPGDYIRADEMDLHPRFICGQSSATESNEVVDTGTPPSKLAVPLAPAYINQAPVQAEATERVLISDDILSGDPQILARLITLSKRYKLTLSVSQGTCRLQGDPKQLQLFCRQFAELIPSESIDCESSVYLHVEEHSDAH